MDLYTDEMGFKYEDFLKDLQVSCQLFAFVNCFSCGKKNIQLFTATEPVLVRLDKK